MGMKKEMAKVEVIILLEKEVVQLADEEEE